MTKEELIKKLTCLEWEDFEVKAPKSELPKSVWETVSAFSNTNGGWIIFGVKENRTGYEITGVYDTEKLELDFLNTLRGTKLSVFVGTKKEVYKYEEKAILAFHIPVHRNKPVYFNTRGNTFIRRENTNQRATQDEIDSMLRDKEFGTKTTELAPGTNRNSLNDISLNRYRDCMVRYNPKAGYNRFDETGFLEKLRIMENGKCTYAGLLMFGKRDAIVKHFPDFRIDLLEIPGMSYSDVNQSYIFRIDEQENLWEYYFECFAHLKKKVDVQFESSSGEAGHELSPGLKSIHEALVNMLIHADYFSSTCSHIRIFTNLIEFYNPGGIPKPFEEFKNEGISLQRNPVLTKLFRIMNLTENPGLGFNKMEDNWKVYNNTLPEFKIEFDKVILNFYLETTSKAEKTSEKKSEKML